MYYIEERVPTITRANEINRLSAQIEEIRRDRDETASRMARVHSESEGRLRELQRLIYEEIPPESESLQAVIPLIEKVIIRINSPHNRMDSSSLNQWFETKLNIIFHQFQNDAELTASTYHQERGGSQGEASSSSASSQSQFTIQQARLLESFVQTKKTQEDLQALLESFRSRIFALEEEKDRLYEENNSIASPLADDQAAQVSLERQLRQLSDLKQRYQVIRHIDEDQCTPFEACQFGKINVLINKLPRGELPDLNMKDERRYGMLHIAAYANQYVIVDFLLTHGADQSLTDEEEYYTPMHWAARGGHSDIISRLYQDAAGTHPIERFFLGTVMGKGKIINSIGGMVKEYSKTSEGIITIEGTWIERTPLHMAAFHNRHRAVRRLLELGADVNRQTALCDCRKTPLIEKLGQIDAKIAELCLEGFNRRQITQKVKELGSHLETMRILINSPKTDLTLRYTNRESRELTPFHMAVELAIERGSTEILEFLLHYPKTASSIFFKNRDLLKEITQYANTFNPSQQTHRPAVFYTIEKYKLLAQKRGKDQLEYLTKHLNDQFPGCTTTFDKPLPIDMFIRSCLVHKPVGHVAVVSSSTPSSSDSSSSSGSSSLISEKISPGDTLVRSYLIHNSLSQPLPLSLSDPSPSDSGLISTLPVLSLATSSSSSSRTLIEVSPVMGLGKNDSDSESD